MGVLLPMILTTALFSGVALLCLLAARRFGGKPLIWVVGTSFMAFYAYEIMQTKFDCAAEPLFIPPSCNDASKCGDGMMISPCHGPVGAMAYSFIYFYGPLMVVLVSIFTYLVARTPRKTKLEA